MRLDVGYATHRGRVRPANQDAIGVFGPSVGLFGRASLPLFVVADGMGGHQGGEVASQLAVRTIAEVFTQRSTKGAPAEALRVALEAANRAVLERASRSSETVGMGTTVVAATIAWGMLHVANVGDSRAYLIHNQAIRQITRDHSLVAEQVRRGQITQDQAAISRIRNVITRSLGRQGSLEIDLFEEPLQEGDMFLLCTDGLWGQVSDAQMLTVLTEIESAQEAIDKLIRMALVAQAPDNVSAIAVKNLP